MRSMDRVVVVFNPESTGDAPELARTFVAELARRAPDLPVELVPTEHAGHARDLAEAAAEHGAPLVVSVSGDGGYNEVVDGVARSGSTRALCAVLAAGNANDHSRATQDRPLVDLVLQGEVHRLDLMRMTTVAPGTDGAVTVRHAHSYIGVGLTPVVAAELEKGGKGSLGEIATVVRTLASFTPFELDLADGGRCRVASLLLANIDQMAKVATLTEGAAPDDGRFEVVLLRHRSTLRTLATAVRAATRGLGPQPSVRSFAFRALDAMPLQLDGEVVGIAAGTSVRVDVRPGALATLR